MDDANFPWADFDKKAILLQIRLRGWSTLVSMYPGSVGFRYTLLKRVDWLSLHELSEGGFLTIEPWSEGKFFGVIR